MSFFPHKRETVREYLVKSTYISKAPLMQQLISNKRRKMNQFSSKSVTKKIKHWTKDEHR
jgi:hypothetical protein